MIHTILDTDLYKFTTSYAYIKLFPYAIGTFSFKDRDETVYTEAFLSKLKAEVANLANVALTDKELEYMTRNCRFLPPVYWEWLSSFRFQPEKIDIHLDKGHHLNIEITDYIIIFIMMSQWRILDLMIDGLTLFFLRIKCIKSAMYKVKN